jgi:uncharacterized membrane protein YecN with MAPEG domain
MELTSAHAAALWSGLLLILLLVLSVGVVRQRRKHRVAAGDGGAPELLQAMRAFGNASEYVPAGIAALAVLAAVGASPLAIHLTGVVLFIGRVAHAVGLSRTTSTSLGRTIGMSLTWLAYVFAAVALIFYAIV